MELDLLIGILSSILAAIIIALAVGWYKKRKLRVLHKEQITLGRAALEQGLTKFHFSRDDYGRTLASFLNEATQSITIVSISLKNTDDEGQLSTLFRRKVSSNPSFIVTISLINPNNEGLLKVAADTLNISKEKLIYEVTEMLKDLLDCFEKLDVSEQARFKILVHDCFPMGSVVMLDTTPTSGMIQVETKLYKAARTQSFGFQLTKESEFFKHNFTAWNRIISDSKVITRQQLDNL